MKKLSFFCVFLPVEMQQKVRKVAWFMGCGTLYQRASGFQNCVQHLIFGVFLSIAHTPHSCLFHLPVQKNGQNACVSRASGVFEPFLRVGSSEKTFFFRVVFLVSENFFSLLLPVIVTKNDSFHMLNKEKLSFSGMGIMLCRSVPSYLTGNTFQAFCLGGSGGHRGLALKNFFEFFDSENARMLRLL